MEPNRYSVSLQGDIKLLLESNGYPTNEISHSMLDVSHAQKKEFCALHPIAVGIPHLGGEFLLVFRIVWEKFQSYEISINFAVRVLLFPFFAECFAQFLFKFQRNLIFHLIFNI